MSFTATYVEDALTSGVLSRRVIAWCIDAAVICVIVGALWVGFLLFGLITFGLGFGLMTILPLVPPAYHVLFLVTAGAATPGQRLMGLTVRRDADLGPPGLLAAIATTIGLYVTLATGVIWLAVALFTTHKRTLHDLLAGLVVVNAGVLSDAGAWYPRA